jgi:hypothetical protein
VQRLPAGRRDPARLLRRGKSGMDFAAIVASLMLVLAGAWWVLRR